MLNTSHPDTYHSHTFALKLSSRISLQKNPTTLSNFSPKNPATFGPLFLQSPAPRSKAPPPTPASAGAAHRRQNQVLFCLFRLDFSFSFRFSSSLTLLWVFGFLRLDLLFDLVCRMVLFDLVCQKIFYTTFSYTLPNTVK